MLSTSGRVWRCFRRAVCTGVEVVVLMAASLSLAHALEFRSIKETGTVFYEAPASNARKLFVVSRDYPVEVLSIQKEWARVRDATGSIAWVSGDALSTQAMLLVTVPETGVRETANEQARIVFRVAKDTVMQKLEPPRAGWVKVKHREGSEGYLRISDIWGL